MAAQPDINDIIRRIENIVRAGTVVAVDLVNARCRVQSGGLTTAWLSWYSCRAGTVRRWSPPSVGEQCIVLSPGGETAAGVVLYGINSDAHPAPDDAPAVDSATYADGATISYDQSSHTLKASLPAGGIAEISAPAQITLRSQNIVLDAELTSITGMLNVQKLLTFLGGMSGRAAAGSGAGSAAEIIGTIKADEVLAGDISLRGHHHEWGSNDTSEAKP